MSERENLIVRVEETKVILIEGVLSDPWLSQIPRDDDGIYQLRPIAREWESDAEHGSYVPVYGWCKGSIPENEWPSIGDLPDITSIE